MTWSWLAGHTCIQHCLSSLKFGKPTKKIIKHHYNRHKRNAFWVYRIKMAYVNTPLVAQKINKEKLISGSLRGNFWQSLISPEARKERSCQSFSASHMGPRADCPFHSPAYFRPACIEKHSRFALIVSSVCGKMALAHQRARGPHLFFILCNQLIKSFVWQKTHLIFIAENWINKENSG